MDDKRKVIFVCMILVIFVLVSACAQNNNDINDDDINDNISDIPPNPDQDIDLTKKLLDDEEVSDGQIYIRDEWAIGAIILNDDVSEERAQVIAQEYADAIKEKYSDKKINVQVLLNGKNVANIEL